MGGPTQPLTRAVAKALRNNPTYGESRSFSHHLLDDTDEPSSQICSSSVTRSGLELQRCSRSSGLIPIPASRRPDLVFPSVGRSSATALLRVRPTPS